MRIRLLVLSMFLFVIIATSSNVAVASSSDLIAYVTKAQLEAEKNEFEEVSNPPSSTIDNIEVPYAILEFAQLEYQGQAVDKVTTMNRDNQKLYRLRVAPSSTANDFECKFLLYDSAWKLVTKETVKVPVITDEKQFSQPQYDAPTTQPPAPATNVPEQSKPIPTTQPPAPATNQPTPTPVDTGNANNTVTQPTVPAQTEPTKPTRTNSTDV